MIIIGLGANLPSRHGGPVETLEAAIAALAERGIATRARSRWYESAPVPASDQPWFVNGVIAVETALPPEALLAVLHDIEAAFGRVRTERNAARCVDLDLLLYGDLMRKTAPLVPHPRMTERAFVLLPLRDVWPDWVDPRSGRGLAALIAALPEGQEIRALPAD